MFEIIRKILCPFDKILSLVPKSNRVLDIGCGHGIFTRLIAIKFPDTEVLGIDPSSNKIRYAKKRAAGLKNLKFKTAYVENIKGVKFDCITILDVLYLLPKTQKLKFLTKVVKLLKKDGVLLLKITNEEKDFLSAVLKLEESLMVNLFRFTHSDNNKLYFIGKKGYHRLLRKSGFKIIQEKEFVSFFPYRHPVFIAKPV